MTETASVLTGKRRNSGLVLALVAAAVTGVLLITVGAPIQLLNTAFGVWFTEVFAFLAPGWVILRWSGYDPLQFAGARHPTRGQLLFGFAIGAANFLGAVVPLQFVQQPFIPQQWKEQFDASRLFQNQGPLELMLILAGIVIAAPFCEEFVFRGMIQKGLAARFSERTAIFATAVLFSAFHLDPLGFVSRVELGILFGVLYQRSGSLWPGAAAHAANNLVSATLFLLSQKVAPSKEVEPSWQQVLPLAFLGWNFMALLIALARRKQTPEVARADQAAGASVTVADSEASTTSESTSPVAPGASQVAPTRPFRLLTPWLAAASASLLLLVAVDRRGLALNLYDLAYHLPPVDKDASLEQRQAREQLKALRAKARRGEVPIAEYVRQRRALRTQIYDPGLSRQPPPPRGRLP